MAPCSTATGRRLLRRRGGVQAFAVLTACAAATTCAAAAAAFAGPWLLGTMGQRQSTHGHGRAALGTPALRAFGGARKPLFSAPLRRLE
ncbi:unnamed protein product, partial [Polarella glacialis]